MSHTYTGPTGVTKSIFTILGTTPSTTISSGYYINGTQQTSFGSVISTNISLLPYGCAGYINFQTNGTDLGRQCSPVKTGTYTGYYYSFGLPMYTHTLTTGCTKFMVVAIGGGGGGGSGGAHSGNGGFSGNSGTGGNCVYAAFPVITGVTQIPIYIGAGGSGGAQLGGNALGNNGGGGGSTIVKYNNTNYIIAEGGVGGQGGGYNYGTCTDNAATPQPTIATGVLLANSLISATGTWVAGRAYVGTGGGNASGSATSGFFVQQANSNLQGIAAHYIANGAIYGNGGSGGRGDIGGDFGLGGSAGTGGSVEIYEYFN